MPYLLVYTKNKNDLPPLIEQLDRDKFSCMKAKYFKTLRPLSGRRKCMKNLVDPIVNLNDQRRLALEARLLESAKNAAAAETDKETVSKNVPASVNSQSLPISLPKKVVETIELDSDSDEEDVEAHEKVADAVNLENDEDVVIIEREEDVSEEVAESVDQESDDDVVIIETEEDISEENKANEASTSCPTSSGTLINKGGIPDDPIVDLRLLERKRPALKQKNDTLKITKTIVKRKNQPKKTISGDTPKHSCPTCQK